MPTESIRASIVDEIERLTSALRAIDGTPTKKRHYTRRNTSARSEAPRDPEMRRRTMSATAKKRLSAAMKKRWAERRKAAK